jgi:hypothetical protein
MTARLTTLQIIEKRCLKVICGGQTVTGQPLFFAEKERSQ